ncbi:MAG TPA: hypothetical protein VK616_04695 [Flavitalea sp.]|nr:hypothetical protein [Flavitalea sp.]
MKKLYLTSLLACIFFVQHPAFCQTFTATPGRTFDYYNTIGVNIHLRFSGVYHNSFESIIYPKLKKLGIKHVRDGVPYKGFLNTTDTALIKTRMLKLYDSLGIRFSYVLDSKKVVDSVLLRDSANYLSVFKETPGLKNTIQYLEGFNEPDLNIFTWYPANWDTLTYAIQKGLWNKAKSMPELSNQWIVGTSLVSYWSLPSRPNKVAAFVPHISTYFDRANFHTYDAGNTNSKMFPSSYYDLTKNFMETIRHGEPFVITETGYENALNWNVPGSAGYNPSTYHYLSELASAKYYSVLFIEMIKRGAHKVYGYEFIDQNTSDQANSEKNFGLLHTDGSEKPAFTVVKNMITIMKDNNVVFTQTPLTYKLSGDTTGLKNSLFQKSTGNYVLGIWQGINRGVCYDFPNFQDLSADSQNVKLILPFKAAVINVYQPLYSAEPIYTFVNKDTININVPDHLLFVEFSSSSLARENKQASGKNKDEYAMSAFSQQGQNSVNVSLSTPAIEEGDLAIYNSAGVFLAKKSVVTSISKSWITINCNMPSGVYLAVFKSAAGIRYSKFIK